MENNTSAAWKKRGTRQGLLRDACTKAVELGYRREEDDGEDAEEDEGLAELRAKKAGGGPTARRSRTAG